SCQLVVASECRPLREPRQAGSLSDIARHDFHYFRASQRDMKAPQEINHEETKSTKVFSDPSSCSSFLRG
ncbi:MAG: hypothetical protein ACREA2_08695, partial [Blastocatellia bacterium]